jgi:hypothetical protein
MAFGILLIVAGTFYLGLYRWMRRSGRISEIVPLDPEAYAAAKERLKTLRTTSREARGLRQYVQETDRPGINARAFRLYEFAGVAFIVVGLAMVIYHLAT